MKVLFFALFTFLLSFPAAQAGIVLGGTRVIYPATKPDVTFGITSHSTSPRLIQAWVYSGDPQSTPGSATAPFVITPPVFRLNAEKSQQLRILFTGGNVPQGRESVYWLNVLEVPPKPGVKAGQGEAHVQFTVRSRIKIFYRPAGLPGSPDAAVASLRWRVVKEGVECENPSAFNVSINDIGFEETTGDTRERNNGMCPAKGTKVFAIKKNLNPGNNRLYFTTINDYGGLDKHNATYSQ